MQVAIYGGMPAAVDSFRIAREVFAEIDGKGVKGRPHSPSVPGAREARVRDP